MSTNPWNIPDKPRSILLIAAALMGMFLVWWPQIPLGIPNEWVWNRHTAPTDVWEWLERLLPAALIGAGLFAWATLGCRKSNERAVENTSIVRWTSLLVGLVAMTLSWQWALQQSAPAPYRDIKPLWIVYDKYASGYFYEAAFQIESAESLLAGYEDRMREGDVLHVGTHPPGLFMVNLAALDLARRHSSLVTLLKCVRPAETERAFRQLELEAGLAAPLTESQLAALHLVSLFTSVSAALTVLPVFLMGYLLSGPAAAKLVGWKSACLYATIPAIAVFMPKSDVVYPLTMTTFLALSCAALICNRTWIRVTAATIAGITLFAGMLLSLAHLPGVVVLSGFVVLFVWQRDVCDLRRVGVSAAIILSAWAVCVVVFSMKTHCNLPVVWKLNLTNHEGFYETSTRTWWKWTLVNPLELALSVGLPLTFLVISSARQSVSELIGAFKSRKPIVRSMSMMSAFAATWCVLWLSGKNMGEAARLWCFLMPWLAIAGGLSLMTPSVKSDLVKNGGGEVMMQPFGLLLLLQLMTAVATVSRVNGFSI